MNYPNKAQAYQNVNLSQAASADSHLLIQMLYDGALQTLAGAKGAMQRNQVAEKGLLIGKVISILDGLRAYLDLEKGGEIARNLSDLYVYMENSLFEANFKNDIQKLDEVGQLLGTLRSAWAGIREQVKDKAS